MSPFGVVTWNPKLVVPPGARFPLYDMLVAVIVPVVPVSDAFHEPETACPAGSVNVTRQPVIADVRVFVTVTGWTTYPLPQRFCTVETAVQPLGPPVPVVVAVTVAEGADVPLVFDAVTR